jgi:hypothetical protein
MIHQSAQSTHSPALVVPTPYALCNEYEEIALNGFFVVSTDEDERTTVTLRYPEEEKVCNHGLYELQVKVCWTAILARPGGEDVEKRWSSVPQKPLLFS